MQADAAGQVAVSVPEIRAALARALASSALVRSPQLQRLLTFLVEEVLAGRGERLKEYVIGVEVFARPSSYDPRLDSLVRVEARRLRVALEEYYAGEGRTDPVVIDLHKGSYVPSFRRPTAGEGPGSQSHAGRATERSTGHRRAATAILMLAIVVLGVVAAIPILRPARPTALGERDMILLADFSNSTGEPVFDEALRQGLSTALEQSPFLNVLSDRRVGEVLKLMGRSASDRVTGELAREVCTRAGSRAMVEGTIARLGGHYVIGLTAVDCASRDAYAHAQAEAASREKVLAALGRAAADMRGKLGESLASIRRFDTPVEEATTASLEALQAFSMGRRVAREKGSPADIPFYTRAIEIDPNFAVACAALGVSYVNLGQPSVAAAYLERAHALRERVSEREQYRIAAYYYHVVTGELDKANDVYGLWKQSYPREVAPYINLGIASLWLGDYYRAATETAEALRLEPGNVLPYSNLAALYIKLGRPSEAEATLEKAKARNLASRFARLNQCYLAFLRGDTQTVDRLLAEAGDKPGEVDALLSLQSDTEAYLGRLRKARDLSRRAVDEALRVGAREAAAGWRVNAALREAEFGQAREAREAVADALRLAPGRDVVALAALASARAGDTGRAEQLLRDLVKSHPLNTVIKAYWGPTTAAAVELARANPAAAVDRLKATAPYEMGSPPPIGLATMYPVYLRGAALLQLRDGPAAAREFEKLLGHPGLGLNFPLQVLAHLQLGRARALAGDLAAARQEYSTFLDRWKDADPNLRLRQAAQQELARLR
ncbi:MAG: tetratricopeptide repeat protein [Bacteroidales bacterium]